MQSSGEFQPRKRPLVPMSYRSQGVSRYRESVRSRAHDRLDSRVVSAEMFVEPHVNGKAAAGLRQRRLLRITLAGALGGYPRLTASYARRVKERLA